MCLVHRDPAPRGWGRQRLLAAPPNPAAASTPSPLTTLPVRGAAWLPPRVAPCAQPVLLSAPPPTHPFDLGARTCLGAGWSCLYSAFLLQLRTQRLLHLCLLLAPLQGWHRPCQQGNPTAPSTQPRCPMQHGVNPGFRTSSSSSGCPPADQEAELFEQSFDGCWQELCTCGGALVKGCEPLISRGFEPSTTTDPGLMEAALGHLPGTRHRTAARLPPRAARAARGAGHGPGVAAKGGKLSSLPQLAHYSPFLHHSCP